MESPVAYVCHPWFKLALPLSQYYEKQVQSDVRSQGDKHMTQHFHKPDVKMSELETLTGWRTLWSILIHRMSVRLRAFISMYGYREMIFFA